MINSSNALQSTYKKIILILCSLSLIFIFIYSLSSQNKTKDFSGSRQIYWTQAIKGFIQSPLIGNGPETFSIINRQLLKTGEVGSNAAHSSFLSFLSANGIFFTLIFYAFIIISLFHNYRHNRLLFSLGIVSLLNSLLDPSWNSPGIFTLSLIVIFYNSPLIFSQKSVTLSKKYLTILTSIIFIFFISKTTSDLLFLNKQYDLSLKFDPFNLNSRLATIDQNLPATLKLFKNEALVYQKLVDTLPFSQSQPYYLKLISLDPQNSHDLIIKFIQNNSTTSQTIKIINNLNFQPQSSQEAVYLSKYYFKTATTYWQNSQKDKSLDFYLAASKTSPGWSQFIVELANAYWHTGAKDQAVNILKKCIDTVPTAKNHCQQYLIDHQDTPFELPDDPNWIKSINDISPRSN